jgi:hypothetical protein
MRQLQTLLDNASVGSAGTLNVSLNQLQPVIGGLIANLASLRIRIAKSSASAVRPHSCFVAIRDGVSGTDLFAGSGLELLAQQREDGSLPQATYGSGSAADSCLLVWRPGYGADPSDRQHAAALFSGGNVSLTMPSDSGQTFIVDVVAELRGAREIRLANKCRTLTHGNAGEISGSFLLARLRDVNHAPGSTYRVTSGGVDLLNARGRVLTDSYEAAMNVGSPQTGVQPCLVRAAHGQAAPLLTKLPESVGAVSLQGFGGSSVIYSRIDAWGADEAKELANRVASATSKQTGVAKVKTRFDSQFVGSARYMPLTVKVV